jgi:xylulokinase
MVSVLAIDIGSSSVKAGVLLGTSPAGGLARVPFPTAYDGTHAQVSPAHILRALAAAAREATGNSVLGKRRIEVIALSCMSPSWVAIGTNGKPLSPIITHQDRRSTAEALHIEESFGRDGHLAITGNRPVPGGISSTTALWFARNHKTLLRKTALVGHLQTFAVHTLTGARAMDPSNASFTGLWQTINAPEMSTQPRPGWHEDLVRLAGLRMSMLPDVLPGDGVAGQLHASGARLLGLPVGTPVLTGVVDTSAAVLLAGSRPGMLINVCGSTDVLAVVTESPRPDARYLTRHLGVGKRWLSVMTIGAAGSALVWAKQTLFSDLSDESFFALVRKLCRSLARGRASMVTFQPYLAGSRVEVMQPAGSFGNLRLSTTREEMLEAVIRSLSTESAKRLPVLRGASSAPLRREVLRAGGTSKALGEVMYREWRPPGKSSAKWKFVDIPEATLVGLGQLAQGHPV